MNNTDDLAARFREHRGPELAYHDGTGMESVLDRVDLALLTPRDRRIALALCEYAADRLRTSLETP